MWCLRILLFSILLFIQLIIIADVLNQREAGLLPDAPWVYIFLPVLLCLVVQAFAVAGSFVQAITYWLTPDAVRPATVAIEVDADGVETTVYGGAARLVQSNERLRLARIYFFDALFDAALLFFLTFFVALLIDQLARLDDALVGNEHPWLIVFMPLFAFFVVLLVLLLFGALRVCGEERYQRRLGNAEYCGAACGGVLVCCAVDQAELEEGNWHRRDKRPEYIADGGYHELPCVFICTPGMSYGWADFILAWLFYLFIVVLLITLFVIALQLDGIIDASLNVIFIGLYIVEILLAATSFALLVSLCLWWRGTEQRPRGRLNIVSKYMEALFAFVFAILLFVQQILLAQRIEDTAPVEERQDWQVVFIPLDILFILIWFISCCDLACYNRPPSPLTGAVPEYVDIQSGGGASTQQQQQQSSKMTKPVRAHRQYTSAWGVLQ